MDEIELLANLSAIAASIAVIVTAVFVWRQVAIQRNQDATDTKRFLREALSIIHESMQDEKFRIARTRFFDGCHEKAYEDLSHDEKRGARFILSVYGLMTRMVRTGAIDEPLYREYWQSTLLRDWRRLEKFVEGERQRSRNANLFDATEELALRWSEDDD